MAFPWFDAHLDLAYLAVNKRDMLADVPPAGGTLTLPALAPRGEGVGHGAGRRDAGGGSAGGGVRMALATIFTEPVSQQDSEIGGAVVSNQSKTPEQYAAGDVAAAHRAGRAQLEVYLTWQERGHVAIDLRERLHVPPGTGEIRGGMGVAEPVAPSPRKLVERTLGSAESPLHIGILIENADVIRAPDELAWWRERGVVAIGMSWATPSRYAGGNGTPWGELGLTPLGFELAKEMDRLKVMHDLSHLSDRAADDLLSCTRVDRPLMASHSNSRTVLFGARGSVSGDTSGLPISAQRHLSDRHATEIIRRRGVIGLNLYSRFLALGSDERPSLDTAISHIEHWCELAAKIPGIANPRWHVALGSDLDGGFGIERLPLGIDAPRDFDKILSALSARNWSDDDLFNFACGNMARALSRALS